MRISPRWFKQECIIFFFARMNIWLAYEIREKGYIQIWLGAYSVGGKKNVSFAPPLINKLKKGWEKGTGEKRDKLAKMWLIFKTLGLF